MVNGRASSSSTNSIEGERIRTQIAVLSVLLAPACVGPTLLGDGTSVSLGTHSLGTLRSPAMLPPQGDAYRIPSEWRGRHRNFGTDELVELVVRVARRVRIESGGGVLGVADLSAARGGATDEHSSHQSGRDLDLMPYSRDKRGEPAAPPENKMVSFDSKGRAVGVPERRFDDARNWLLVRALVTDSRVDVQWIFVGAALKARLLAHAERVGESTSLRAHAAALLHQPTDAQKHDDHLHVRIYCSPRDRALGCWDRGPGRWQKKFLKPYPPLPQPTGSQWLQVLHLLAGSVPPYLL